MHKRRATILLLLACLFLAGCSSSAVPTSHDSGQYVGSVNSDKYHLPDCQWAQKIKPENEAWFDTREEAESAGYVACKVCDP